MLAALAITGNGPAALLARILFAADDRGWLHERHRKGGRNQEAGDTNEAQPHSAAGMTDRHDVTELPTRMTTPSSRR